MGSLYLKITPFFKAVYVHISDLKINIKTTYFYKNNSFFDNKSLSFV
jgi:hypothetical protein